MDKEQTKVQGIRFCKDGYSFKGTQISRDYSFGKLNARFEGMEKHVSSRDNSTLQYEQGYHKSNHEPSMIKGHHTDYFYNGVPLKTKGEYDERINAIIPEAVFKTASRPTGWCWR